MELSDKIKKIRKDNNLSQEKFAEEIGVSRQSIVKYEKGVTKPLTDVLIKICQRFNISLDYFVNDDELIEEVATIKDTNNNVQILNIVSNNDLENPINVTDTLIEEEKPKIKKHPIFKKVELNYKKELKNDKVELKLKKFGIIPLSVLIIIIIINIVGLFIDYIWLTSLPLIFVYVFFQKRYRQNWYIDHFVKKSNLIKSQYEIPLSPQYKINMELLEDGIYILHDGNVKFYCDYDDFDHHVFVLNNQTVGELLPVTPRCGDMIYTLAIYLKGNGIPYTISFPVYYKKMIEDDIVGIENRREYLLMLNHCAMKLKQVKENNSR